jgi:acetyl-CoA synthetase
MLTRGESYDAVRAAFRWQVPARYNIGVDVCDKHVAAGRGDDLALIYLDPAGAARRFTFRDIQRLSNRLANALMGRGLERGNRIGVLLPQAPETAIAHVAAYKAGLVAVPLFTLFGEDALEYRLGDSGARALVTDRANLVKLAAIRDRLPNLELVLTADGDRLDDAAGATGFWPALEAAADAFTAVDTAADDPAIIIYTSGTTGPPKGALHAHRVLLGHMPGAEFYYEFPPQPGDRFWTPADWAWIGGLFDSLLPAWRCGIPVVAHRARKFDPEHAFALMAKYEVRNAFLPPTALKLMRQVPDAARRHDLALRSVISGGESLGAELLDWCRAALGVTVNEIYGQTECNLVLGCCAAIMQVRPGSMGLAVPGHEVAVMDGDGQAVAPGTTGEVCVRRPDPVMLLEYWRNPAATRDKFTGDWPPPMSGSAQHPVGGGWLRTGDLARRDEGGYFWYVGRTDDVITSAGYRIGPGEVEECLLKHPAVAMAAAVGVPDPVRTELVKAFIVPAAGVTPGEALADEIRAYVKTRLAAHEYPRLIEFVDELPLTATGKIMRRVLRQREIAKQTAAGRRPAPDERHDP